MDVVREIKARLDIVEVVGERVKLRRSGRNFVGLCPFHTERTPSFVVSPERQTWRCFGACNEGGDLFSFVMKAEGIGFREALEQLARRAGVPLRPPSPREAEASARRERLRRLLEATARFYRRALLGSGGETARRYLRERGIEPATAEAFELGFAPPGWRTLLDHLRGEGFSVEEAVEAGVAVERQEGLPYDRFRNRIVFPIRDEGGRLCGFGGRILPGGEGPKYLNTPATPLYDKGRLLYGLHLAREAIRRRGAAVLVEGYFDVIRAHQAGFRYVVAPLGTALTEGQVRLLARLTSRLILALDADEAGERAVFRALEAIRAGAGGEVVAIPDWKGRVRLQERTGVEVRVLTLPEGTDPDELIARDPEAWRRLEAEARPLVDHWLEAVLAGADLSSAAGKRAALEAMVPILEELTDPIHRGHYLQRVARALGLPLRYVELALRKEGKGRERRPPLPEPPGLPGSEPGFGWEGYLLSLLLRAPQALAWVPVRGEEVFVAREDLDLLAALREAWTREGRAEPEALPEALRDRARWLREEGERRYPLPPEGRLQDVVEEVVRRLALRRLEEATEALRALLAEVPPEDPHYGELLEQLSVYAQVKRDLSRPRPSFLYDGSTSVE